MKKRNIFAVHGGLIRQRNNFYNELFQIGGRCFKGYLPEPVWGFFTNGGEIIFTTSENITHVILKSNDMN